MPASKVPKILKWVGYCTAILSLLAAFGKIVTVISDRMENHRKIRSLLAAGDAQREGRDYRAAWQSLEQAYQIDPNSTEINLAQENLAMEWLEHISLLQNEKFSDITQKLEPVLTRGVVSAKDGPRKADLQAHIGWIYFLLYRDGNFSLDPAGIYAKAVQTEKNNPYAEAMWGHWTLWNRVDINEAELHFSSALSSNRQRAYVRELQLSALLNHNNDECQEEIIRVVNAIRKEHGSVDSRNRERAFSMYYFKGFAPGPPQQSFINAVPPAEHLATFEWLFPEGFDQSKSLQRLLYLAVLQEAAGQDEKALASYRLVRSKTENPKAYGSLVTAAEAGINRLSHSR